MCDLGTFSFFFHYPVRLIERGAPHRNSPETKANLVLVNYKRFRLKMGSDYETTTKKLLGFSAADKCLCDCTNNINSQK